MSRDDDLRAEAARWRGRSRGGPTRREPVGPGEESVWNYPRPPRVEPARLPVQVELSGTVIARTSRALRVLETASPPTYYIPPGDVRTEYLEPSVRRTLCEWKGQARYWSVRVGDVVVADAAWSYPDPWEGFTVLRDYLAFFAGKMDACYVGDDRVTPQPGDFYGGWVTPGIKGPFKGDPGTGGW